MDMSSRDLPYGFIDSEVFVGLISNAAMSEAATMRAPLYAWWRPGQPLFKIVNTIWIMSMHGSSPPSEAKHIVGWIRNVFVQCPIWVKESLRSECVWVCIDPVIVENRPWKEDLFSTGSGVCAAKWFDWPNISNDGCSLWDVITPIFVVRFYPVR